MLVALPEGNHKADAVADALARAVTTLPAQLAKSLTWDLGHEMAQHQGFSNETGMSVYFSDPNSPWQRGSNETRTGCCANTSDLYCLSGVVVGLQSVASRRTPVGLTRVLPAAFWLARLGCVAPAGVRSRLDSTEA